MYGRGLNKVVAARFIVIMVVMAIVLMTAVTSVGANPPIQENSEGSVIPHTLIGRSNCLRCHEDGFGEAPVNPDDHNEYLNEDCQECHEPGEIPDPLAIGSDISTTQIPAPLPHPPSGGMNTCYDCHVVLDDEHNEISVAWEESVHGSGGIGCEGCHGGDARTDEMNSSMAPDVGFIGVPSRAAIPVICGGCHSDVDTMRQYNLPTDQFSKYIESVHGSKLKDGDTQVAICTDCHGIHDVKKASDPTSAVYPLNVPDLCASCHSDATIMEPYGIPTNQYDTYELSVHGEALLINQDTRAPNCASCHGSHAAKPPDDEEVINVCGKCHTATQAFYEESLHARIGEAAPKCWTCHGTHDIFEPDQSMFMHDEPQEQFCGTCHIDDESFRMDKSRFAAREDRKCDTCHHEGSMIMTQVSALHSSLVNANLSYLEAEEMISQASARGMIVNEAENKLAEARTSLIMAQATLHTTKLPVVRELTDEAEALADTAHELASARLGENIFRRQAMVVAIGAIVINIGTLYAYRRKLYRELDESESIE